MRRGVSYGPGLIKDNNVVFVALHHHREKKEKKERKTHLSVIKHKTNVK